MDHIIWVTKIQHVAFCIPDNYFNGWMIFNFKKERDGS